MRNLPCRAAPEKPKNELSMHDSIHISVKHLEISNLMLITLIRSWRVESRQRPGARASSLATTHHVSDTDSTCYYMKYVKCMRCMQSMMYDKHDVWNAKYHGDMYVMLLDICLRDWSVTMKLWHDCMIMVCKEYAYELLCPVMLTSMHAKNDIMHASQNEKV